MKANNMTQIPESLKVWFRNREMGKVTTSGTTLEEILGNVASEIGDEREIIFLAKPPIAIGINDATDNLEFTVDGAVQVVDLAAGAGSASKVRQILDTQMRYTFADGKFELSDKELLRELGLPAEHFIPVYSQSLDGREKLLFNLNRGYIVKYAARSSSKEDGLTKDEVAGIQKIVVDKEGSVKKVWRGDKFDIIAALYYVKADGSEAKLGEVNHYEFSNINIHNLGNVIFGNLKALGVKLDPKKYGQVHDVYQVEQVGDIDKTERKSRKRNWVKTLVAAVVLVSSVELGVSWGLHSLFDKLNNYIGSNKNEVAEYEQGAASKIVGNNVDALIHFTRAERNKPIYQFFLPLQFSKYGDDIDRLLSEGMVVRNGAEHNTTAKEARHLVGLSAKTVEKKVEVSAVKIKPIGPLNAKGTGSIDDKVKYGFTKIDTGIKAETAKEFDIYRVDVKGKGNSEGAIREFRKAYPRYSNVGVEDIYGAPPRGKENVKIDEKTTIAYLKVEKSKGIKTKPSGKEVKKEAVKGTVPVGKTVRKEVASASAGEISTAGIEYPWRTDYNDKNDWSDDMKTRLSAFIKGYKKKFGPDVKGYAQLRFLVDEHGDVKHTYVVEDKFTGNGHENFVSGLADRLREKAHFVDLDGYRWVDIGKKE